MTPLRFTLVGDGGSDRRLLPVVSWAFRQHIARPVLSSWADLFFVTPKPTTLAARVKCAVGLYEPDVLVVHRDAEGLGISKRMTEIDAAVQGLAKPPVVHLVPIRMQEAWLLFDEPAIRQAADNPNGTEPLALPSLSKIESVPHPKDVLIDTLRTASGLSGRHLQRFKRRESRAAHRVADLITDFAPLRNVSAFRAFETEIRVLCTTLA